MNLILSLIAIPFYFGWYLGVNKTNKRILSGKERFSIHGIKKVLLEILILFLIITLSLIAIPFILGFYLGKQHELNKLNLEYQFSEKLGLELDNDVDECYEIKI